MAWYTLISGDVWVSVFFSNFLYENSGLNVSFSVDLMLQGKKGCVGFWQFVKEWRHKYFDDYLHIINVQFNPRACFHQVVWYFT